MSSSLEDPAILLRTDSFEALSDYVKACDCGYGYQVKQITETGNRFFCIGCDKSYFISKPGIEPKTKVAKHFETKQDKTQYQVYNTMEPTLQPVGELGVDKYSGFTYQPWDYKRKKFKATLQDLPDHIQDKLWELKIRYETLGDKEALEQALKILKEAGISI